MQVRNTGTNHYTLHNKTWTTKHQDTWKYQRNMRSQINWQEGYRQLRRDFVQFWMSCNYWMSHKSSSEEETWFSLCRKWVTWRENDPGRTTNFIGMEEEEFKVLNWPCQSPDLNHVGMCRVSETRISCLLSWSGSVLIVGSKLIPSGIPASCVYIIFFLCWKWKETVRGNHSRPTEFQINSVIIKKKCCRFDN